MILKPCVMRLTGGGSTKSPRENGSLTKTVYAGSGGVEAIMDESPL